ncbi:MAG: hypothetical protein EXR72_11035 [Myxococcales bacterium]|nr:hypothetical protein [Myxococcales bacterium]
MKCLRPLCLGLALLSGCGRSGLLELPDGDAPRDAAFPADLRPDLLVALDRCADGPRRLVVLDQDRTLARFRPDALVFTPVGQLNCPTSSTPNSMAVRQDGIAYVNYHSGELFAVNTSLIS